MYFSEITDDIYTIAEDETINNKNFDNINRNVDKSVFKKQLIESPNKESNVKNSPTNNVNNEVKISQKNTFKSTSVSTLAPVNKDNSSNHLVNPDKKELPNDTKPTTIINSNKLQLAKPIFQINVAKENIKEKDNTLILSAIIDENETQKPFEKIKNIKNETLIKNGSVYQTENRNKEDFNEQDKQVNVKRNKENKKKKDESLDFSDILSDNELKKNQKSDLKTTSKQEKNILINEDMIKISNNNNSISDISINAYKIEKNINEIKENNSILTSKNQLSYNSKIYNKVNNGGTAINGYIQKKLSQIESDFLSSKHQLEKMLLNDENKIIQYEAKLEYKKVYDLLKKQNMELVKNFEKMNNYLYTITEGTKSADNKGAKTRKQPKPSQASYAIDNKIISVYKKEYNIINARLTQISDPHYFTRIENILNELNRQVTLFETENKKAKNEQKQSEVKIGKTSKIAELDGNSEIKKINYDYEHYQKQLNLVSTKINKNKDDIEAYNHRVEELNQNFLKLIEIGNFYGISESEIKHIEETVKEENIGKKENDSLEEKKTVLLKKIEIIKKVKEQIKNKYESLIKGNVAQIYNLENNKRVLLTEMGDKSKVATGNNQKVREFYERHKNINITAIIKDFNILNETIDKNKQNTTNYSSGNLGRRQILSSISEEIPNENKTSTNNLNKSRHLMPIEEKDRDLEETVGRNKLEELINEKFNKDTSKIKLSNNEIKDDFEKKEKLLKDTNLTLIKNGEKMEVSNEEKIKENKEIENNVKIDKYGIKAKPNFKIGKAENKDLNKNNEINLNKVEITEEEKADIKPKKLEKDTLETKQQEKRHDIINNFKVESPSIPHEKVVTNTQNSQKQIQPSEILDIKTSKIEANEEPIFEEGGFRRKKPAIVQQNSSFLPLIENREAKEKAEREKLRGKWSNNTDNDKLKQTKIEELNTKLEDSRNKVEELTPIKENTVKKIIEVNSNKENLKTENNLNNNVPLFLQNTSNKSLLETKNLDYLNQNKDIDKSQKYNIISKEKTENKIDEEIKIENKMKEEIKKTQIQENLIKIKKEETKKISEENKKDKNLKTEKKTEKTKLQENKTSLFSNIFADDDDDLNDNKIEKENEKIKNVKKKEDFDKLFSREFTQKTESKEITSNINATKEKPKQIITKTDLTSKSQNEKSKETEKTKPVKKKNPLDDLDELII